MRTLLTGSEPNSQIGNGRVARALALLQGARRENILYGSSTDEQRGSSAKDRQPGGLFSGGRLAALLLSHRALWLCSFVAPWQPASRKQRAHSLFMRWVLNLSGRFGAGLDGDLDFRHIFSFPADETI